MTLHRTQNNIPGKSLTDGTIPMPSHPHCRPTSQPLEAAWWLPWSGFSQESFAGALCYVVCCAMSSLQWPDFPQMIHRLCWFAWKNSFCSYNECIVDRFVSHKFIYFFLPLCHFWLSRHINLTPSVLVLCLHECFCVCVCHSPGIMSVQFCALSPIKLLSSSLQLHRQPSGLLFLPAPGHHGVRHHDPPRHGEPTEKGVLSARVLSALVRVKLLNLMQLIN